MNNNYFGLFSGTIKGVEVETRKTVHGTKSFTTVVLLCTRLHQEAESTVTEKIEQDFYLRCWGDKYQFEVGKKVHLLTNIEYRRVKSKKGFMINSQGNKEAFEYGAFDFTIVKMMNDKELAKWYKERSKDHDQE